MLSFREKAEILKNHLEEPVCSYADSFRTDIMFYFDEFEEGNARLNFLKTLETKEEIKLWVERITSLIVLKFNEAEEQLGDFVFLNS